MIVCDSKVNSIKDLRSKGIIDEINVIQDMDAFNIYNNNITAFAKTKYGVFDPVGSKLFSVAQRETKLVRGSTYLRDNIKKSYYIVPNDSLFNAVEETVIREEIEAELNEELRDENYGIEYGDETEPLFFRSTNKTNFEITINSTESGLTTSIQKNGMPVGDFVESNDDLATIEPINISSNYSDQGQKLELFKELGLYYLNQGVILKSGPITASNQEVWNSLFSQGQAYKVGNEFFYTDKELDPYVRIIDTDRTGFEKQRAREIVSILGDKLARALKINYALITPEEAKDLLANRVIGYNGEAAFFFANTAYFVGDNFNLKTLLHEFSHPLLGAIRRENPELFNKLYSQLLTTDEGDALVKEVQSLYPELQNGSQLFKEEVLAHALQKASLDKVNEELSSKGFLGFIQDLLYHFKKVLRAIFPSKIEVSKMTETTTLEELADMLLTKEFNYQTQMVTEEDVVMYGKFSIDRADEFVKDISESSAQKLINSKYNTQLDLLRRAKKFRSKSKEYKALQEAIFQKGTRELLPSVLKTLKPYQTTTSS
ncbi:MAG: hypothetical protein WD512_14830, partial [Candidatus Paceibacterota bacterium]